MAAFHITKTGSALETVNWHNLIFGRAFATSVPPQHTLLKHNRMSDSGSPPSSPGGSVSSAGSADSSSAGSRSGSVSSSASHAAAAAEPPRDAVTAGSSGDGGEEVGGGEGQLSKEDLASLSEFHRYVIVRMAEPGFSVNDTRIGGPGLLPLHYCALKGDAPCLEMLLAVDGVDVNLSDEDQMNATPLNFAARRGHNRCVKLLLNAGATVNSAAQGRDHPAFHHRE